MQKMDDYGMQLFRRGIVFHSDRRPRRKSILGGSYLLPVKMPTRRTRGIIRAFSRASQKRLSFVLMNATAEFQSFVGLTYHALTETWESDEQRNRRVVKSTKRDLNRFLTALRERMGAYLWVQEFQQRGVVHYHLLCERELDELTVRYVWLRSIGSLEDLAARRVGAKVERVRSRDGVGKYLGIYVTKGRQKFLPAGVNGAGRWWGSSRSIELDFVAEIGSWWKHYRRGNDPEVRTVRCLRKFVSRALGFKFKGGMLVDWSGSLAGRAITAYRQLSGFYGVSERPEAIAARYGWEAIEGDRS